jgi:lipid A disaccharide synthetase
MIMESEAMDILILSNGPGEVTTWVRPVVKALRQELGEDRNKVRISVILSPCPNATGKEVNIAKSYPEVDRVQGAEYFMKFLLSGKTLENWDWRSRGIIIFLGGDQFFPIIIGKRLGYKTVVYAEWQARWHSLIDRFAVMKQDIVAKASPKYIDKFTVVGDLMAEVGEGLQPQSPSHDNQKIYQQNLTNSPIIGILPGSKAAKLSQGVPLMIAIAEYIQSKKPSAKFIIPVAPTLDLETLASFGNPEKNPFTQTFGFSGVSLISKQLETSETQKLNNTYALSTKKGLTIDLITDNPAHKYLSQCSICLTTVGANTAELGSLGVPMIVLLPTQQLDAMRAWDGLPGLLANLPGVGSSFAKVINWFFLRKKGLLAWPNIWAQQEIVPELVGKLQPEDIGEMVLDYLDNPPKLETMRHNLKKVRGETGAAQKIAKIIKEELA